MGASSVPRQAGVGSAGASAFEYFYRAEFDRQVRRAALVTGSTVLAHDVVQDAFIKMLGRWPEIREPRGYLSRAVLNGCRDQLRQVAVTDRRLPLLVDRGSAEDEVLWDVLNRLPFNQRAALVLRYYEQLSEREIAAALGCRQGSVGPWITRGLRSLRKELS